MTIDSKVIMGGALIVVAYLWYKQVQANKALAAENAEKSGGGGGAMQAAVPVATPVVVVTGPARRYYQGGGPVVGATHTPKTPPSANFL